MRHPTLETYFFHYQTKKKGKEERKKAKSMVLFAFGSAVGGFQPDEKYGRASAEGFMVVDFRLGGVSTEPRYLQRNVIQETVKTCQSRKMFDWDEKCVHVPSCWEWEFDLYRPFSAITAWHKGSIWIFYVVKVLDDCNVDVPSWKYPRNLESPRVSSPGFDNDSKMMVMFSLQSDSRRTLIWRAPGTPYHQENTIERHRYGGAGWLVWGGIILGSRTDLHVQSVMMTGHIYRDVILEQHVRLFRGAEFLFMDDNARPHRANIIDECLQSEDISILTGLESNRACVGYAWPTNCISSTPSHMSTGTSEGIA
ncbi:DDE_3 domain-containing protein [Trichonephila clavipes]|nr:DDE_3 domain-containing protein [Trichonephila clavipes]